MILTAIRLRNIKSFVDAELRFARGINIIAGRNGAGKSTVIEAVGLTLFDAWPQRFKDGNTRAGFLRHGEREGSIEIDVLRDGTAFTVRCDLAQRKKAGKESIDYERVLMDEHGADIAKSAGRKKEFQDDLRRELLGEARIDDEKLFRDIIGTEQGAFDEPFTRIESERRALFEKILGIEDFQDFEKQFYHLLKYEAGQAKELGIRLQERGGVPGELSTAETALAERESAATAAAAELKSAGKHAAAALKSVDALAEKRDALQKAQSEQTRLLEKLNGEEATAATARGLRDEAAAAAKALEAARAGHEAFVYAEKQLGTLRLSAKQREATGRLLSEESTTFEKTNADLFARRQAQEKERKRVDGEISDREKRIKEMKLVLEELRESWRQLDETRKEADTRAALATELRSYVQDLRTTSDALQNAGEKMRSLRETFTALTQRLDELTFDVAFLPALREETELLYSRHSAKDGSAEEDQALARMFVEAKRIEAQLKKEAADAADLASRKEQEGKSERKQFAQLEKEHKQLLAEQAANTTGLLTITARLEKLGAEWQSRLTELRGLLDAHGDVESSIAANEKQLEEYRGAHASFLSLQDAASKLGQREQALLDASAAADVTRKAIDLLAKQVLKLGAGFSEEEYAAAKSSLEAALLAEKTATAAHSQAKAFEEEQRKKVKELLQEFREFERLRLQATKVKAEAEFTGEVHQHVVRELARHVGASIVSALSAFAGELYARIAPEQDLALYWDPQTYAVELRGATGAVRGRELSGGQLMGVSLAVKLALIKWYSQCRIGFLDEPTTHLDRETRRHLADVIQHLEQLTADGDPWFDQLFVISHEESFAGSGHRIELERAGTAGSIARLAE